MKKSGLKALTWAYGFAGLGGWDVLFPLNDLSRCSGPPLVTVQLIFLQEAKINISYY